MTQEQKRKILLALLEKLLSWPKDFELAPLIHHCLKIINIMSEHDRHSSLIAMNLRIIIRHEQKICLKNSMKTSIADVESRLPPELRGFSNLFDIILEENNLRINTQDLIENFDIKYQEVAQIFLELNHKFDTYDELNNLFDAQRPKVLVVMFLRSLCQILNILDFPAEIINFWLENLQINTQIINLYNQNISCDNLGELLDKDSLILFLCLCSTQHAFLSKNIAGQVARALEQTNFPALLDFVNWGFVSLDS